MMKRGALLNSIFISILMLCCMSGWNPSPHVMPMGEQEVTRLMALKMDVNGWDVTRKGDTYLFTSRPADPEANGRTYAVNAKTGTVYDETSGGPETNLYIKESPNFKDIWNGTTYWKEILKLANAAIAHTGMVPDRELWVSGGYGDGYVYGDVLKDHKRVYIKLDVFTKKWEEIEKP
ncbi:hypothetical protein MUG84_18305 [Paenibacillus sp. KQZ6P-2]|uniref:Uncharacterized protein n=1 Tax=Paenibacillus mangrovi TaxID=2931978 RepID=A0A9X2B3Q7_9BACL|nr:hypothetical protein [Paenibacillus mangrovi]MCJ8013681.1 hypothetical protein [Paenibacillus mangrovi]